MKLEYKYEYFIKEAGRSLLLSVASSREYREYVPSTFQKSLEITPGAPQTVIYTAKGHPESVSPFPAQQLISLGGHQASVPQQAECDFSNKTNPQSCLQTVRPLEFHLLPRLGHSIQGQALERWGCSCPAAASCQGKGWQGMGKEAETATTRSDSAADDVFSTQPYSRSSFPSE